MLARLVVLMVLVLVVGGAVRMEVVGVDNMMLGENLISSLIMLIVVVVLRHADVLIL